MLQSPAFGQADLSNCERELIHLPGSVQAHGVLMVLRATDRTVLQVTDNATALLGRPAGRCLGQTLAALGGDLDRVLVRLDAETDLSQPQPLQAHIQDGGPARHFEGLLHRAETGVLVLELEPLSVIAGLPQAAALPQDRLQAALADAVRRFGDAPGVGPLADAVVCSVRELTGYDRVMVYRFDPDGHGKIIAEARDPRLDTLLGHHYPSTDIPQRARELYVRNRVRVLVDAAAPQSPLVPAHTPPGDQALDMSLCGLRSMSPLHIQYLKNMGVTATLVVSLVSGGRLWGLIAAHHYRPRNLRLPLRAACALLAEVMTTRLAAIENYAHAQVALLVRRLEQRLVEATSTEGDWRFALFRHAPTLLQPLDATGAVLFHDGEVMSAGDVPSTPELRALRDWLDTQCQAAPFACNSIERAQPALDSLTPLASGVLAVRLAADRPDFLVWLRKEQLQTVTWAGNPSKPTVNDSPLELSPRRSFAAWSELVRGTALPWSVTELALARAIGSALIDIIVQVHAVRLLIAERQIERTRATIKGAQEPVLVCRADGRPLFANAAFEHLTGRRGDTLADWAAVAALFTEPDRLAPQQQVRQPWRAELALRRGGGAAALPVGLRVEPVPARDGSGLGLILTLDDRSEVARAAAAREALERSITEAARPLSALAAEPDAVMQAIVAHARLAAMDIAEASRDAPMAPVLEELTASTQRAAQLVRWIRRF